MLAGLQTITDSLFPAIRGLAPSEETLEEGKMKALQGRIVKISGYHTEVFDMHVAKERNAYNRRMLDLSKRAQLGTVRLLVHDRQTMSRKDGSSGWFGYLEWMEYSRKDEGDEDEKSGGK